MLPFEVTTRRRAACPDLPVSMTLLDLALNREVALTWPFEVLARSWAPRFSGSARLIEAFEVDRRTLLPFSSRILSVIPPFELSSRIGLLCSGFERSTCTRPLDVWPVMEPE